MPYLKLKMLSGIWVSQKHTLDSKNQKDLLNRAATQSKMKKEPQPRLDFLELSVVEPCSYWQSFNIFDYKISLFI